MGYFHTVKVLEQCKISPPSGSVPNTTLPLAFFDLAALCVDPPIHCLYFYGHQSSTTHFMDSIVPDMKHSLSLTLQHFFPLAGHLTWPPKATVPEIVYVDGDSVSFTVAQSDFSFDHLSGYHAREAVEFSGLTSQLLPLSSATTGIQYPLLALQVTLFPDSGICVGLTMSHAPGDGMAWSQITRYWGLACSSLRGEAPAPSLLSDLLPSFDRSTIIDPHGIQESFLKYMKKVNITQQSFNLPSTATTPTDPSHVKLIATYVIDLPHIEKLKKWVLSRIIEKNKEEPSFKLTSLVVTCAFVWVCLIKAMEGNDDSREHFIIPADCRTRMDPPLPVTYFGNCLSYSFATVNKNDLVGEDGIVLAAESMGNAIKTILEDVLANAPNMLEVHFEMAEKERLSGVSATPRMKLYDVNFGWGNPKKIETISSSAGYGWLTMCEYGGHANKGIEFGVALKKHQIDVFTSVFEDFLSSL
ncbi:hypothetical protein GIB67_020260 [Kingdonia uniflora]|uniref:Uncharacterized protein n=1 Tax=Kingdonia uniflora TaxID=39325 RepID=A0A7J7P4I3_9MAGN|nr:hypothetical protein GIB67_020260 [Kingdonia uniflora]